VPTGFNNGVEDLWIGIEALLEVLLDAVLVVLCFNSFAKFHIIERRFATQTSALFDGLVDVFGEVEIGCVGGLIDDVESGLREHCDDGGVRASVVNDDTSAGTELFRFHPALENWFEKFRVPAFTLVRLVSIFVSFRAVSAAFAVCDSFLRRLAIGVALDGALERKKMDGGFCAVSDGVNEVNLLIVGVWSRNTSRRIL
jgi:hypothetical protein